MDKRVSQRGAAANDGSRFKDVTERGRVPLSTERTPWAGRSESEKRRLKRIRELEERVREEKKKATKAALDELMALVEDSQRSGPVVVYYRMSECTDINARCCGKVCRKETAPPHHVLPIYTSNTVDVHARAHACAHAILRAWVRGARAHHLHMLCQENNGTSRGKECGISKSLVTDRVKNAWKGIRGDRVRAWGHKG
jgi:hypothetical protein